MPLRVQILLLTGIFSVASYGQGVDSVSLNIGDKAPYLQVNEWIKGTPFSQFEKGHIYVVEFWATWCAPCIKAMPQISKLARKYKRSVTFVGINVLEKKKYPREKALALLDSMGRKASYAIAFEDSNFMEFNWLNASGEYAVPSSFVVNKDGMIAWIGHPNELDNVLPKVLDNSWDINTASAKRIFERCIYNAELEAREQYARFGGTVQDYYGEPDSVLFYINKIVAKDPDLKYAFNVAYHTFIALLKTDMKKAYEYAKAALQPSNPLGPAREAIVYAMRYYTKFLVDNIPAEIYQLSAEAIDGYVSGTPKNLMLLAEFYWRAGDKANARISLKKARKAMKSAKLYGLGHFF